VRKLLEDKNQQGGIKESNNPWSSPVILVWNKNGDLHFSVDYRKLNVITKKHCFPLPRIDNTLDTLATAKWLSTLKPKSHYWQVVLNPDDEQILGISVSHGLWQFMVTHSGLCTAPVMFEWLIEAPLKGTTQQSCLVYLDNVIVVGHMLQELDTLQKVFHWPDKRTLNSIQ
jgi:hypothetical protein